MDQWTDAWIEGINGGFRRLEINLKFFNYFHIMLRQFVLLNN